MKSKFVLLSLVSLLSFALSCNKEQAETSNISAELVYASDCLHKSDRDIIFYLPDSISQVYYFYDPATSVLTLSHRNAGFNCCPGEISCEVAVFGSTIIVTENEEAAQCHCNCLYDLNIQLLNVPPGTYLLKFHEPYASDLPPLIFEIDLSNQPEGTFSVTRHTYPWGVIE